MWKSLAATGFAGAFLAMAVTPSAAIDEQFALTGVISLPDAQTLSSFDISFVDPQAHALGIAASRVVGSGGPFGTVIIVNTDEDVVTAELRASPPFVGNCTFNKPAPQPSINGPNGVIIITKGRNTEVWAADGPVFSTPCMATTPLATPSTVKVLDLNSGATIAVIPTGTGAGTKTPGIRRADELCYNPRSHVVLVANNDPLDSFITFIDAGTFNVIERIRFDGTDPNGDNILANGIEQCVFNPRDGKFYLAFPATGTAAASKPGVIVRISAAAPFKVEKVIADFSKAPWNTTACTGSAGMAAGPAGQLALSCGLIINDNGAIVAYFPSEGNSDEMWYNSGNNHYYLAVSTCKQTVTTTACLGVIDAGPPPSADTVAGTAPGSHSVAADLRTNQVFVPIRGNVEVPIPPPPAPPPALGKLCSTGKDVFGNAGSDALGCIAIYAAPSDQDDHAVRTHNWGRRDNQ
jgi:hypothetical protein